MAIASREKQATVQSDSNGLISVFQRGDIFTKLSFIIFGMANLAHKQIVKGLIYLAIEVAYIGYMIAGGVHNLIMLTTLGTQEQGMAFNEATGIVEMVQGDNSMLILLWGVVTCVITFAMIAVWVVQIYSGELARQTEAIGKKPLTFVEDIKALFDGHIHRLLLAIPVTGLLVFTVMPLIYMILMAFTNYDQTHQPPGNLFTWVGLKNFQSLVSASADLSSTFWPVLGWTVIWGFVATFSCYFGGMILAMIINSKGIAGKKVWRTIFVTTMGIPSFISLLVMRTMLGDSGIINVLLQQLGFTTQLLPFLSDVTWARCTVIIPLSKPIAIYTLLTNFLGAWSDYIFPSMLFGDQQQNYTVAVGLYWMTDFRRIDTYYTQFAAGALVVALPIVILFICLQKFYVEGLSGAVKG